MEDEEDIRKRQIFGKLNRILLSAEGEIYIILSKDKITDEFLNFLRNLEKTYGEKDIILTFHSLKRGLKKEKEDGIIWKEEEEIDEI